MKANQLKWGVVLSYVILILDLVVGLVYMPILTRKLGQSEYGLYSLVASIISYLTILDLGFGSAIIVFTTRYRAKNEKEKEQQLHGMFLIVYTIIGIVIGILGYILYLNVDSMFGNSMTTAELSKAKVMMLLLTANLAITFPTSVFSSIITSYEKFVVLKIFNIIKLVVTPLIMVPLLYMGYKSITMIIVNTTINIILMLANTIYCLKYLKIKMSFKKFDFKLLRETFAFSVFNFLNVIVDKINWSADQFVLGALVGTASVAIYNIATHINTIYLSFSTAISGVLLPKMTKMETNNSTSQEFSQFFIKVGRLQYILMALIITGFVLVGKEFVILWQGIEYVESYYIACILMIPVTIPLIQNTGLSILQAKNKHKFRTMVFLVIAILNIAISIPLAKLYGGIGTAIGTAIALIIGQIIIMNIYYYKKINIDIIKFWKDIIKISIPIIIAFIIGVGINMIIIANSYLMLVLKILIYTLIYFTLVWNFAMNDYEKGIIKGVFDKIARKLKKKEMV